MTLDIVQTTATLIPEGDVPIWNTNIRKQDWRIYL